MFYSRYAWEIKLWLVTLIIYSILVKNYNNTHFKITLKWKTLLLRNLTERDYSKAWTGTTLKAVYTMQCKVEFIAQDDIYVHTALNDPFNITFQSSFKKIRYSVV